MCGHRLLGWANVDNDVTTHFGQSEISVTDQKTEWQNHRRQAKQSLYLKVSGIEQGTNCSRGWNQKYKLPGRGTEKSGRRSKTGRGQKKRKGSNKATIQHQAGAEATIWRTSKATWLVWMLIGKWANKQQVCLNEQVDGHCRWAGIKRSGKLQ